MHRLQDFWRSRHLPRALGRQLVYGDMEEQLVWGIKTLAFTSQQLTVLLGWVLDIGSTPFTSTVVVKKAVVPAFTWKLICWLPTLLALFYTPFALWSTRTRSTTFILLLSNENWVFHRSLMDVFFFRLITASFQDPDPLPASLLLQTVE